MARYLVDTNHIRFMMDRPDLRQRVDRSRGLGDRFGISIPILCELEAGISGAMNPARLRGALDGILNHLRVWPMDAQTAKIFGQLHADLRRRGRSLSTVDITSAALAHQLGLTILSADADFQALPDIKVEDWTSPRAKPLEPLRLSVSPPLPLPPHAGNWLSTRSASALICAA